MGSIKGKNKKNMKNKQKQRRGSDLGPARPDVPALASPSVSDKKTGHKGGKHDGPTPSKDKSAVKSRPIASTGVEPAELPLPHTIKGHESAETEGLTKMQRDMKAKLEGARFRSASSCCLESPYMSELTECVSQVDQRAAVLYALD